MIYKYCPDCGGECKKEDKKLYICKRCGIYLYDEPSTGVCIFLQNQTGKMLFTVRNLKPFVGSLGVPGGFAEKGESLEEALKREIEEETGLKDGYDFNYFESYPLLYPYKGVVWNCISVFFYGRLKAGDTRISDHNEIRDLIWTEPKKELADKIMSPDTKKAFLDLWERKIIV